MVNRPDISPEATDAAWDLAETLTFARQASGAPMNRVARKVGVAEASLRAWEYGEFLPGLAAFVAWAQTLDYEVVLVPVEPR